MKQPKINQILEKLDDDEKAYLSKFFKISRSQARKILTTLASAKLISYDSIPSGLGSKVEVVSTLETMERIGLAKSEMIPHGKNNSRTFHITPEGKSLAQQYSKKLL